MTEVPGSQMEIGAAVVYPTIKFQGNATSGGTPISGIDGDTAGRVAAIPDFYAVFNITDRLKGGIAVTVPFGNTVKYKYNFYGRYVPGGLDTAALSADINPSLAYKISDNLSIGAGFSAHGCRRRFECHQSGSAACDTRRSGFKRALQGQRLGFGYDAGVLFKPWAGGRVGLSYRSMMRHQVSGSLNFTGVNSFLSGLFANQAATADINLPSNADFSVTQDFSPALTMSWELQWTGWSTFNSSNVNGSLGTFIPLIQDYKDSWMTSVGGSYHPTQKWTWRGGLGWDQTPVRDTHRTVGVPDMTAPWSPSVRHNFSAGKSFDAAYTHYFAAHANMNSSVNGTDMFGTTTMHGDYQLGMDFLAGSFRFRY